MNSHGEPWPLDSRSIERAIAAMERGVPFKAAYEELLLGLDDATADLTMQLQREARGAWLVLLREPVRADRRARALLIGNSLSGTSVPLANHGFDVTLFDSSQARLRFATLRNAALAPQRTTAVLASGEARLPFDDASFDLVVQEDGPPSPERGWRHDLGELRRVCAGEFALIADNRFAYKRSRGRRGKFHVAGPFDYARHLFAPRGGERSLRGYRALLEAPDFERARAFALYPHAREFTFVVGLDAPLPRLAIGPKERQNKPKLVAQRLGLFPLFAPSFALVAARGAAAEAPPRIERILAELARKLDAPAPEVEHLVATRGNSALVLTRGRGDASRWCVHIGLSPAQRSQLVTHFEMLRLISERFAGVPVPAPLFIGEVEGVFLTCEQRLGGLTAPQLTGDRGAAGRMLADAAQHMAGLAIEPARALDETEFERLLGRRFELVARFARVPSTLEHLARMRDEVRATLVGRAFPRVVYHADLRGKHVQVERDGRVLGYLDWGSSEQSDLPYFDLLHFVAHERKQEEHLQALEAWRLVRDRSGLREYERAALDDYSRRLGLDDEYRRAIERVYPVLVAAMAEKHWDFSRPEWLHRQFGV
jgi:aminoglycoside phosphotransferase (APT) family kinase protein